MTKITIGEIRRKSKATKTAIDEQKQMRDTVRKQIKKMKVGESFEIKGIADRDLSLLRAAITYYSKQDRFKVKTVYSNLTLEIERVRVSRATA